MPEFTIHIPVVPVPQKRHRSRVMKVNGKDIVQTYKASEQREAEDNLRQMLYRQLPSDVLFPIHTAIVLHVIARLQIPYAWSRKKQDMASRGAIHHTSKPDVDNLLKHILDVSRGVLYVDDRQISTVSCSKRYSQYPGWFLIVRF